MKKLFIVLSALIAGITIQAQKYLGGDISLLPTYRQNGTEYKDQDGKTTCPYKIFKQSGWNAMRVRLFVDPANAPQDNKDEGVCQDLPYVVNLCKQIKKHGFKLMLLGMGVVYVFLVVMIIAMNLLKRALAPFAGMLEPPPKAPAKKKPAAASGDDAQLAAIAAAAVEAARSK